MEGRNRNSGVKKITEPMIMIVDDPIEPGEKVGKEKYLNWIAGFEVP